MANNKQLHDGVNECLRSRVLYRVAMWTSLGSPVIELLWVYGCAATGVAHGPALPALWIGIGIVTLPSLVGIASGTWAVIVASRTCQTDVRMAAIVAFAANAIWAICHCLPLFKTLRPLWVGFL